MQTKSKHKILAVIGLYVASASAFWLGQVIMLIARFNVDMKQIEFHDANPGTPFPPLLQLEADIFQNIWISRAVGLLLCILVTYFFAKKLKFVKPVKAAAIIIGVVFLFRLINSIR